MTTTDHLRVHDGFYSSVSARDSERNRKGGVNERYPHFSHTHFTAGDEEQFDAYREPSTGFRLCCRSNESESESKFHSEIHNIFKGNLSRRVITNTFRYIFHKFKKGIYVKIRDGKLVTFLPFSNAHFVNEYSDRLQTPDYMKLFRSITRDSGYKFNPRKVNGKIETWFANNCLVRYEYPIAENDTNVNALRDFLDSLTSARHIPDIDFFINKRDYPIVSEGKYEPYNHIYDSKVHPLVSHKYDQYAPIFSFSRATRNSDILMPTVDDWIRIASSEKRFFRRSSNDYWPPPKRIDWNDKKSIAIWRGSSTGSGTTAETNQRIKLAQISKRLMLIGSSVKIDAGITSWKRRPRKLEGCKGLRTLDTKNTGLYIVNKIPFSKHAEYKYVIHVGGHAAAYRLASEFGLGSVVVLVKGEYELWFQKFLVPDVHFVQIKPDLSNLVEKIQWLQSNDDKARQIASAGLEFFEKYLSKEGILDYMQDTILKLRSSLRIDDWVDGVIPSKTLNVPTVDPENFTIVKELKRSKKSTVHIVSDSGVEYALKEANSDLRAECELGVHVVNKFSSHFMNTVGISECGTKLLSEYIAGPTLLEWIHSSNFNTNKLARYLYIIFSEIKKVQETNKFMHNDLCPTNIILQNDMPVIIDFGRSRGVSDQGDIISCYGYEDFSRSQDVMHLIITVLFHVSRRRTSRSNYAFLKILSTVIRPNMSLRDIVRYTDLESKFSRLTTVGSRFDVNIDDILKTLFPWKDRSPTRCLTSVWVSDRHIQEKLMNITNPIQRNLAFYVMNKEIGRRVVKGRAVFEKLRNLTLDKVYFLNKWSLDWLKKGLIMLNRAMRGDKLVFDKFLKKFDAVFLFSPPLNLTNRNFRKIFPDDKELVEKYLIFLLMHKQVDSIKSIILEPKKKSFV